jgi:hypothetical protein
MIRTMSVITARPGGELEGGGGAHASWLVKQRKGQNQCAKAGRRWMLWRRARFQCEGPGLMSYQGLCLRIVMSQRMGSAPCNVIPPTNLSVRVRVNSSNKMELPF